MTHVNSETAIEMHLSIVASVRLSAASQSKQLKSVPKGFHEQLSQLRKDVIYLSNYTMLMSTS